MNLLQVQDSLKNASDQQLMAEMQNPTGQAPQFLVLSELKRRKDMRGQIQAPTQTVAEDITGGGIPEATTPSPVSQGVGAGVGQTMAPIPGMREGGVVRMQAGGQPPSEMPRGTEGLSIEEIQRLLAPPTREAPTPEESPLARMWRQGVRRQNLPEQTWIPTNPDTQSTVAGVPPRASLLRALEYRMSEPGVNPDPLAVPPFPEQTAAPQPASEEETLPPPPSPPPPPPARGGAPRPNGGPLGQLSAAINPVVAPSAAAPAAAQGLPPPNTAIDRSAFNQILERMRGSEVNQTKAREDARSMALLQAGLAIAGGTSPHFATNLAGAIPHLQNYQTRIADLRKEGRDELKNQFDLAKADLDAQYHAGMLTQHQYATQSRQLENQRDNATRLEAARIGAAASGQNAAASREERIAAREDRNEAARNALDVRKQEVISRALMEDPEAKSLAATVASMGDTATGRAARARLEARRTQITNQYNAMLGIPTGSISSAEDGTRTYVPGGR